MTVPMIFGCNPFASGGEHWKEEVEVQPGKVIVVEREFRYGDSGDISTSHGPLSYASVEFEWSGVRYKWVGMGVWPKILRINASGAPVVVSTIPYCRVWKARGKPNSYYVAESFENGAWKQFDIAKYDMDPNSNLAVDSNNSNYVKIGENRYKDIPTGDANKKIIVGETAGC